jgi:hypothetical protein
VAGKMLAECMPSYITHHKETLRERHYITDATTDTMFFNFWEGKLRDYIDLFGRDFCLVINGSDALDDAFILPYKDFMGFFSLDFLDRRHRWVGNIRLHDETIVISTDGKSKEALGHEYHNAFHLLQNAALPLPKEPDISEFI